MAYSQPCTHRHLNGRRPKLYSPVLFPTLQMGAPLGPCPSKFQEVGPAGGLLAVFLVREVDVGPAVQAECARRELV
eukprot:8961055-Pyramimonas_sp.AAC.1